MLIIKTMHFTEYVYRIPITFRQDYVFSSVFYGVLPSLGIPIDSLNIAEPILMGLTNKLSATNFSSIKFISL